MKALSAKQIEKVLMSHGFVIARQRGSHRIYKHQDTARMVPVPIHKASQPLKLGTFLSIFKQSGIPKSLWK